MTEYLKKNNRKQVIEVLNHMLADTFMVYFKTHAYHWNVEGPRFHSLHEMFEEQYRNMWEAIDEIAERIRALGAYAPMSPAELMKHSDMSGDGQSKADLEMAKELAGDHEEISKHLADAIQTCMECGDEATADMMIARQQFHDKTAWMLRAQSK
jgi:starvation-inducible DNA-binding protein